MRPRRRLYAAQDFEVGRADARAPWVRLDFDVVHHLPQDVELALALRMRHAQVPEAMRELVEVDLGVFDHRQQPRDLLLEVLLELRPGHQQLTIEALPRGQQRRRQLLGAVARAGVLAHQLAVRLSRAGLETAELPLQVGVLAAEAALGGGDRHGQRLQLAVHPRLVPALAVAQLGDLLGRGLDLRQQALYFSSVFVLQLSLRLPHGLNAGGVGDVLAAHFARNADQVFRSDLQLFAKRFINLLQPSCRSHMLSGHNVDSPVKACHLRLELPLRFGKRGA
mmetsp:Transcript_82767/g.268048  ORF Transcript_82767/g.268048 Transcript_82767/m.268048 type:complete len:280 (+) Transcript_82767:365-1204(+)